MDSSHVRHHRVTEAGGSHPGESSGRNRKEQHGSTSDRLEYVLRHSPLWRSPDFSARPTYRGIAGAIELAGVNGGFSNPSRGIPGYAYLRHALALAPRVDESRGE